MQQLEIMMTVIYADFKRKHTIKKPYELTLTHRNSCCPVHGCVFDEVACPVVNGEVKHKSCTKCWEDTFKIDE
jgi:hypothetical protein